uniref:Uncharacterized protein n=1 Tax=Arundo donax TaxID=35708 RepID=A0A0A9DXW7_ARUDO
MYHVPCFLMSLLQKIPSVPGRTRHQCRF